MHVGFQDRPLLSALLDILLAQPHDRAQRLDVEAVALGLHIDVADVIGERLLLLLEALDSLREGFQVILRKSGRRLLLGSGSGRHWGLLRSRNLCMVGRRFGNRINVKARIKSSTAVHSGGSRVSASDLPFRMPPSALATRLSGTSSSIPR